MARITPQRQVTVYTLELSQEELETLYTIVAASNTFTVQTEMRGRGFKVDETTDYPYELYEIMRDALGIEED